MMHAQKIRREGKYACDSLFRSLVGISLLLLDGGQHLAFLALGLCAGPVDRAQHSIVLGVAVRVLDVDLVVGA